MRREISTRDLKIRPAEERYSSTKKPSVPIIPKRVCGDGMSY